MLASRENVMIERSKRFTAFVLAALVLSVPSLATAQVFIYPARGQSPQQEQFDKGQCYSWAVQQSGFDPANPQVSTPPPPPPGAPQGGLFRGAAGGAAMGAVGGAIGGDAGKGAAIGAAVGGLFGVIRRARWAEEQQQQQQSYVAQQQSAMAQGHAAYNRAFSTCMTGRGYTVSM
jgi:predicted lipid-binding transport protein (Tim44 family)